MVQKVASAGIGLLVAISAPTGLAIRIAENCGITLVGFARDQQYVVYSHPQRINH
jgi:FdhD protein